MSNFTIHPNRFQINTAALKDAMDFISEIGSNPEAQAFSTDSVFAAKAAELDW